MGARRCRGTGRGKSTDAKEELAAGTPEGEAGWRRRSSRGGPTCIHGYSVEYPLFWRKKFSI